MVSPLPAGFGALMSREALLKGEKLGVGLLGLAKELLGAEADEEGGPSEITIPVSSAAISAIGYHVGGIISVTFHRGGRTYEYPGTEELFMAFLSAPSKGQFFNQHLK